MITLNFDTFAAWFISSEIQDASSHPAIFQDTVDSFTGGPGDPDDDDFYGLACSIIGDSFDDLVANHETLILISDRAEEYLQYDPERDRIDPDGQNWDSQLTMDMSGWMDDDRLARALGAAYKHQWEFNNLIAKVMAERERNNERVARDR